MEKFISKQKRLRRAILIISVSGILSLLPILSVASFSLFGLFFVLLLISVPLLTTELRIAHLLILFISFAFLSLLNDEVGNYFIKSNSENALFWVFVFPYTIFLVLVPLTMIFLIQEFRGKKVFSGISFLIAIAFPIYQVIDRSDRNYSDYVCAQCQIQDNSQIKISFNSSSIEQNNFPLTSTSRELVSAVRREGNFLLGVYNVNVEITKHFCFKEFKWVSITQVGNIKLVIPPTWFAEDIGDNLPFSWP